MTSEIAEARSRPSLNQEVPFSFEELFFSRTDPRGIILSGNGVFQRVSMYAWDELINKPHKIIRHPDMPRGVFWLLWDTIQKGEPIGAYVKNKAKDGRYYWVFAIVTPIESGYLSVRLKPSAMLAVVDGEYRALATRTAQARPQPKEEAAALLGRLAQLGFDSYGAFMAAALRSEIAARDRQLGREPDPMMERFDVLVTAARSLLNQADGIFAAFAKNEHVPLNLTVQAARLGDSGAAIAVISRNYNTISAEIKTNLNRFVASAKEIHKTVNTGLFLLGVAKIQQEVMEFFRAETSSDHHEVRAHEMSLLQKQQEAYQQRAKDGVRAILEQIQRFQNDCVAMKRLASNLVVTRVMGKIESARLVTANGALEQMMGDLDEFQAAVGTGLNEIERDNQNLEHNARRLLQIMA